VIALLLSIQLYLSGFLGLERTIITFFLAGWFLIIMDNIERRQDTLSDFFFHMTISITLIALHSFIYQGFGLDSIGRVGLIGLGSVMDPNYSALMVYHYYFFNEATVHYGLLWELLYFSLL